ncbi:MAG: hypothetical protein DRP99_00550 [Candidatus Latescibacterota bacterium]|nr:MAG: hypothetical protein DRP99_00550 [Candidatus Latescibacterota bacterium]
MEGNFEPQSLTDRLFDEVHMEFSFRAKTPEEARAWGRAFRHRLWEVLGLYRIEVPNDLEPEQVEEADCGDHVRQKWYVTTEPGVRVPFYLLKPKGATGRLPLVLTPHGHNPTGKELYVGIWHTKEEREEIEEGERDIAVQAVREGYIAIAPDMRGFSELMREDDRREGKRNSCRTMLMHDLLFGRTLVGDRVHDVMRLIDYALTREDVDPERIAITGNSGGGTVSLFAAACDVRIKVSVPGSYFCTFRASIGSIYHCECNYIPDILTLGEMYDVAGLIAPRPFCAVNGREDPIFPIEATKEAYEKLRKVYEVFGVPERCELYVGDGGHRYYKDGAWSFIRKWL